VETTAALRRRIELTEDLRSVTGTMKSLAAVTLHQYERSVHAVHEYVRTVELGLQVVLRARPDLLPGPPAPGGPPGGAGTATLVVVFGSGRGLCGPLNRHVARAARAAVDALGDPSAGPPGEACTVVASGTRLAMELEAVGLAPGQVLPVPASAEGIGPRVEELLLLLDRWRPPGEPGRVLMVQPRPRTGGRQYEPEVVPLLPLDPGRLATLAGAPWPTRALPDWRGDVRQVLGALTRQLVFVDLHRALAETQMCVNRARLAAMQGAEENIGERLEKLSAQFHRQRQAAITGELFDVIAGFEAAGGPGSDPWAR
jgi:F-type H+-transporting ATPase subunit gamma